MRLNIHAGHGKQDSKSCGAEGLIKESIEDRKVKDEVIKILRSKGHAVYDTTVDYPSSKGDCVNKIVSKCNENSVDLDVSIHFNSGANDEKGNGKTTGVEVLVYNTTTSAYKYAERVCASVAKLGFSNRGVKLRTNLAVLKTKNPNMLVECCFVDDKDDINKYNYKTMAKSIVEGILNESIIEKSNEYGIKVYDFLNKESALDFSKKMTTIENAYNEVHKNNDRWCVKIESFNCKESALNFSNKLKQKYNAWNEIYTV